MFSPSQDFFPGTMASADFSQFVVTTHFFFNMSTPNTPVRPPRVLTRSFPLYLPHLPNTIRVAIGLYFDVQTHPYVRPYMRFLFVRPEFCPLGDLSTPKIRLSSDSASRRTPLPLAKFFSLPGDFGTFTLENVRPPGAPKKEHVMPDFSGMTCSFFMIYEAPTLSRCGRKLEISLSEPLPRPRQRRQ